VRASPDKLLRNFGLRPFSLVQKGIAFFLLEKEKNQTKKEKLDKQKNIK